MLHLNLKKNVAGGLTVLCLGAHCDDIEIGCGGTLLYLKGAFPKLRFHWVVFSASGPRGQEAARAAELFIAGCEKEIILKDFRDGFLPYSGGKVKEHFEEMKGQVNPDLIFTHWHGDAHQDHRLISELTWNTFRNHLICEYEIPKYDGDMGRPNLFVPLEADEYQRKIRYILDAFQSQRTKHWFQQDTFLSLLRLRGMECNAPSNHAEAFHCRKLVLAS
jgi:LmbE family N-acetylglucosaminyl deacetylase